MTFEQKTEQNSNTKLMLALYSPKTEQNHENILQLDLDSSKTSIIIKPNASIEYESKEN